jgi:hypothetical protein
MVRAVRTVTVAQHGPRFARIDSGPDTVKIGSAGHVEVHHAPLLAVIGVLKRFHTAWVNRVTLIAPRSLPVFPAKQTWQAPGRYVSTVPRMDMLQGAITRLNGPFSSRKENSLKTRLRG